MSRKGRRVKDVRDMDEFDLSFHAGTLSYYRMWLTIGLIVLGVLGGLVLLFSQSYGLNAEASNGALLVMGVVFIALSWKVYTLTKSLKEVDALEEKIKADRWDGVMKIKEGEPLFLDELPKCPTCGSSIKYQNTASS